MGRNSEISDERLIESIDGAHARVCLAQRSLLSLITEKDRRGAWRDTGARDTAHWLSIRYDIPWWKAHPWITAAHALERLPRICEALSAGELGIDKVVELARFATPEDEARLVRWAKQVSCATVRPPRRPGGQGQDRRCERRGPLTLGLLVVLRRGQALRP